MSDVQPEPIPAVHVDTATGIATPIPFGEEAVLEGDPNGTPLEPITEGSTPDGESVEISAGEANDLLAADAEGSTPDPAEWQYGTPATENAPEPTEVPAPDNADINPADTPQEN